jgi:hypothetical protein
VCQPCTSGTFKEGSSCTLCTICDSGTYESTSCTSMTDRVCTECLTGSYCPAGSTSALPCPAGSYCPTVSTIITCPAGTFCEAGSTSASLCTTSGISYKLATCFVLHESFCCIYPSFKCQPCICLRDVL